MGERLTLRQSSSGQEVTVHIGGHLTWETCSELEETLSVIVAQQPRRIALELSDLITADSSALTKLVSFQRACNERHIPATLNRPAEHVLRTLKMSKLDKVFTIESRPSESETHASLREARRRLALMVSNMLEAMLLFDERGHLILVNPAALALTGYAADQSQTLGLAALAGTGAGEQWRECWEQVKAGNQVENRELLLRRHDGQEVWCSVSGTTARDEDDTPIGLLFTLRNIDEQRKTRARLQQFEVVERVGQLVAGFARDFEFVLESEQRQIEELRGLLAEHHRGPHIIAEMRQQHEYLRDFVARLRALGKPEESAAGPTRLQLTLDHVLGELRPKMGPRVAIEVRFDPAASDTAMPAKELEQVLRQVCMNAIESMGEQGHLRIWSEAAVVVAEHRHAPHQPLGSFVRLNLEDDGGGMTPEVRRRAFDPYFSTHGGRHRGLGLSLVYGLLRLHDGWIHIESEPGNYTHVQIYLPVQKEAPPAHPAVPAHSSAGRLLVVDDEALVLNFAAAYLERFGFEVLKACDAEEALRMFDAPGAGLNLVVTDLSLPGMSGRQLMGELLKINPQAQFLISSGLGESDLAEVAREPGVLGVLQKPYRGEQLLHAVRGALSR